MSQKDHYLGNPLLKRANLVQEFTEEQILELEKCYDDPIYFAANYINIVTLDHGLQPINLYEFQKKMLRRFHNHRFNICKLPRQSGKSTIVVTYLLHYALFNENANIAILANKATTAKDLLDRLQTAYENLPKWMQQGVMTWNKASLELENGSKIIAASTSASAVRGGSYNIIFLDEFAFVPNHIADEFFSSVYPTISSGKSTKVIIVSTPKGMNHFYKKWHDAEKDLNDYIPTEVHWSEVPGRDANWKKQTIANTSPAQFLQEFECEFLGSANTLISGAKLKTLTYESPLVSNAGLDIYKDAEPGHDYVLTVDVSEGLDLDYSAFVIVDITTYPHKVVAKYRNNSIKPILFPNIIEKTAKQYNNAFVLCEVNGLGDQVASILHYDLEYPNILMCANRGRSGQVLGQGFSGKKSQLGVKMSRGVKQLGCSNLKAFIEDHKLIFKDYDIISELTTFVQKGNVFCAEEGENDDLVMALVIYAWMTTQDYFKELTDQDIRKKIYNERKNEIEQDMAPFGFILDGLQSEEDIMLDKKSGDIWLRVDKETQKDVLSRQWNLDEYGDRSQEFDYMWNNF